MAIIDDSFKKPGAIPFSWEIRPGVPKTQIHQPDNLHKPIKLSPIRLKPPPPKLQPPSSSFISRSCPQSPVTAPPSFSRSAKLKPPPVSGFSSPSTRTPSFRSSPRALSERWRFHRPNRVQPEFVARSGCFPTPLMRLKNNNGKRGGAQKKSEPDYGSDSETTSPWSIASRTSVSRFWESPKSSSSSSHWLSPRFANEAEWALFGLF